MFPYNVEFFAEEQIAERLAEGEQSRLGKPARRVQRAPILQETLGKAMYWLGCVMVGWGEMLQYPRPISAANESNQSTS
jgi:hypothetical protein